MRVYWTPELVVAARRCAKRGLSAMQAACELSTPEHRLTRNALIGIAHRRGFSFGARAGAPRAAPRTYKPRPVRHGGLMTTKLRPMPKPDVPEFDPTKAAWRPKALMFKCAWASCTRDTAPSQMLCTEHQKRPLFGPVAVCQ